MGPVPLHVYSPGKDRVITVVNRTQASERGWGLQWLWFPLTLGSALHSAHSGSAVCGDCNTDTDSQPKEQAFHPQPVSRESGRPGTPSSQELRQHDLESSPHHPYPGTADGSHTHSGGSLYPSNHDRILLSLKNKAASPDGKGKYCVKKHVCHGLGAQIGLMCTG